MVWRFRVAVILRLTHWVNFWGGVNFYLGNFWHGFCMVKLILWVCRSVLMAKFLGSELCAEGIRVYPPLRLAPQRLRSLGRDSYAP